ncbi:MAG: sigma-70 family RNA polymerase sigma factor [Propionibacteriaceae bacterium]|nr:sigma-70 family RNA polymerase sigma factor [Propionibacteriaceae bacterium]
MSVDYFPSPVAVLAARLAGDDESALQEMFTRWSRLVHTIARSALGSNADADDVTQQVFIAAWKSRHTIRATDEALPAWLLGICKFKIADALRARSRAFRNDEAAPPDAHMDTISHADDVLDRVVVRDALETLGDPRGTILRMVFLEDKTHEVVSKELEMPLGTVKSHVRRGLEKLRNVFEEVDSLHV